MSSINERGLHYQNLKQALKILKQVENFLFKSAMVLKKDRFVAKIFSLLQGYFTIKST
jgi:hypothetical protein